MKFLQHVFGLLDALQSHNSPERLAGGITLGAYLGLTPIATAHGIIGLFLLLSLRVNLLSTLISCVLFTTLSSYLQIQFHQLGVLFLDLSFLAPVWQFLDNTLFLPYLRLTNSFVLGSFLVTALLLAPLYYFSLYVYPKIQRPVYRWLWEQPFFRNTMGTRLYRLYANYKKKGTIRWNAVKVSLGVVSCALIYTWLFAGHHLKSYLEHKATQVNGATVEIGNLDLNFFSGKVLIEDIRVTNYRIPLRNFAEISKVELQFVPSLIFRRKLKISDFSVSGFRHDTERSLSGEARARSGYPLPSPVTGQAAMLYGSARAELDNNPLSSLSRDYANQNISGAVREISYRLNAAKQLSELQRLLDKKKDHFVELETKLPSLAEIEQLRDSIQNANREQTSALQKKLKQHLTQSHLVRTQMQEGLKQVEDAIQKVTRVSMADVAMVKKHLDLPILSPEDISAKLFGEKLLNAVERVSSIVLRLRHHLLKGEEVHGGVLVKRSRFRGIDYAFDSQEPRFHVLRGQLGTDKDTINGKLANFSSSPTLTNTNATLHVRGKLPKSRIHGIDAKFEADHRTRFYDEVTVRVRHFPIENWNLQKNRDFSFEVKRGSGQLELQLAFDENRVDANFNLVLLEPVFDSSSRNQKLESLLKNQLAETKQINLAGTIRGDFGKLKLSIESPFGRELAKRLRTSFKSSLVGIDQHIEERISQNIHSRLNPIDSQLSRLKRRRLTPTLSKIESLEALSTQFAPPLS